MSVVYDAAKGHVGVLGPATDEDHVGVCCPCDHRWLCGRLWFVLLPEAMLMAIDQAATRGMLGPGPVLFQRPC